MDHLELIRTVMSAANRGEMDVVTAHVHDDFLGIVPPSMSAEPDSYAGPAGVRRYLGVQIRDGKLYRMEAFPSLEEAREELAAR